MTWRYALSRQSGEHGDVYAFREVYTLDGKIGWTANPVALVEGSVEDMRVTLERMLEALDRPLLDMDADPDEFIKVEKRHARARAAAQRLRDEVAEYGTDENGRLIIVDDEDGEVSR